MKVMHIAGARPNFVKIASIIKACHRFPEIESVLVHTGQHYSANMSDAFFTELRIPEPDINLNVGSGTHAQQTAEIMSRFEPILLEHRPELHAASSDAST